MASDAKLRRIPDPLDTFEVGKQRRQGQQDEDARQEWFARHYRLATKHRGIALQQEDEGNYCRAETHHDIAAEHEAKARRLQGEAGA